MTTYRVEVHASFEAAHHLLLYRGRPEPNHGHTWRVSVALTADRLDEEGMVFDFVAARAALTELTTRFDHGDINQVPPFDRTSPTTERLAEWFCREMQGRLPAAQVEAATVWEGPHAAATFSLRAER